jgi:hypothetical protein
MAMLELSWRNRRRAEETRPVAALTGGMLLNSGLHFATAGAVCMQRTAVSDSLSCVYRYPALLILYLLATAIT